MPTAEAKRKSRLNKSNFGRTLDTRSAIRAKNKRHQMRYRTATTSQEKQYTF